MTYKYHNLHTNGKQISEHRYIWEQYNGEIPSGYEIHHRNWNKKDNKMENLSLLPGNIHRIMHHYFPILNLKAKHILKLGYSEKGYKGWMEGLPSSLREHIVSGGRICDIANEWDKLWV